jgi:photosystem II stability/assembly factor-like uncharacterized protein
MKKYKIEYLIVVILSMVPAVSEDVAWEKVPFPQNKNVYNSIKGLNKNEAVAVGENGVISYVNLPENRYVSKCYGNRSLCWVCFADGKNGWAVGDSGAIYATIDSGQSWSSQKSSAAVPLKCAYAINKNEVWCVGDNGTILHTTDAGSTWTVLSVEFFGKDNGIIDDSINLVSVAFSNDSLGVIGGNWKSSRQAFLLITCDRGQNWKYFQLEKCFDLFDISFTHYQIEDFKIEVFTEESYFEKYYVDGSMFPCLMSEDPAIVKKNIRRDYGSYRKIIPMRGMDNWIVRACDYIDSNEIWVAGICGSIFTISSDHLDRIFLNMGNNDTLCDFESVFFVDKRTGFIGGSNGTLLKTIDGGKTWNHLYEPVVMNISYGDIFFSDTMSGYMLKRWYRYDSGSSNYKWFVSALVQRTVDGGKSWNYVPDLMMGKSNYWLWGECKFAMFNNMAFMLCSSNNNNIFYSKDQGLNWEKKSTDAIINEIYPILINKTFAVGSRNGHEGAIYTSNDMGSSFDIVTTIDHSDSRNKMFNSISFSEKSTAWVVGDSGVLLKSTDSGLTWNRQRNLTTESLTKVKFIDSDVGWILGQNNIFLTCDGGLTWKDKSIVSSTQVRDVFCSDAQNCWAVGDDGLMLHLTNKTDNMISISAPVKNKSFKCGDSLLVRWSYEGETKISILLSYDGGMHYTLYKNLTDNDGEEVLKIAANAVSSNNCKIKIVNSDGKVSGESELFSIVNSAGVVNNYDNIYKKISIRNNCVEFSLKQSENARLRVFDVAGKVIYSKMVSSDGNKVITEHIPSDRIQYGCYIVQINAGTEMLTERVFIGNQK